MAGSDGGEFDDDVPYEVVERRAMPLSEMVLRMKPGDRWPHEPAAPDRDDGPEAGDREPRRPLTPPGSTTASAQQEDAAELEG